jgi:hypothetical protein
MGESAFGIYFLPHFAALRNDIIRRTWERNRLDHPGDEAQ